MADLPNLVEAKLFCRIDHNDDDVTISTLLAAAIEFVEQATGNGYSASGADIPDRARTAILILTAHWYDGPDPVADSERKVVPLHVRSMLHQLRGGRLEPEEIEA